MLRTYTSCESCASILDRLMSELKRERDNIALCGIT
jgi:hypothetical protein